MREMPFQSIKFQKIFGGACPRTPLNCSLPCSDVHQIFPKSAPARTPLGQPPLQNNLRSSVDNYVLNNQNRFRNGCPRAIRISHVDSKFQFQFECLSGLWRFYIFVIFEYSSSLAENFISVAFLLLKLTEVTSSREL